MFVPFVFVRFVTFLFIPLANFDFPYFARLPACHNNCGCASWRCSIICRCSWLLHVYLLWWWLLIHLRWWLLIHLLRWRLLIHLLRWRLLIHLLRWRLLIHLLWWWLLIPLLRWRCPIPRLWLSICLLTSNRLLVYLLPRSRLLGRVRIIRHIAPVSAPIKKKKQCKLKMHDARTNQPHQTPKHVTTCSLASLPLNLSTKISFIYTT
mmetsp:Transcript_17427/g.27203  ORF Transcript_17427/g.27203 Transcript_17427/m.27203 type:complete len:207 (-) Transcript_17427:1369-1989(-)